MNRKRKPVGLNDRVVFPRGFSNWEWKEYEDGSLVNPYRHSSAAGSINCALIFGPPGIVGTVVEERVFDHERLLHVRFDDASAPDVVVSPGRDSLSYRRYIPT